jgi:hypothetical protein
VGDRTRTGDIQIHSQRGARPNSLQDNTSGDGSAPLTAPLTGTGENLCESLRATDPDLARVVSAWADLPEVIHRAVLALIDSANG